MSLFKTHNMGAMAPSLADRALEFFSKAGNIIGNLFYAGEDNDIHRPTKETWAEVFVHDPKKALKLLFWSRDPRGGAGHRRLAREILHDVALESKAACTWISANLSQIVEYGRYDDVMALYDTPCEKDALSFLSKNLSNPLCAKWLDRKDKKLRDFMGLTSKEYRQAVVKASNVVERLMSEKRWSEINYMTVPSIAGVRYTSAFYRHDKDRFLEHIRENGLSGAVAFPHEVMRLNRVGTPSEIIQSFFDNLPDFIKEGERIMPMVDVSGSMCTEVSGSISAMDVSISLGLYCSDRLEGEFHRKMMTFSSTPEFIDWSNQSDIVEAIKHTERANWDMSTDVGKALDTLLESATTFSVPQSSMPTMLLIMSDMQFDETTRHSDAERELTVVEESLSRWVEAGYNKPSVVYWNLQNYDGQPSYHSDQVAFISGFSPAVMESVLACVERDESGNVTKLDPVEVMETAISKYEVVDPFASRT